MAKKAVKKAVKKQQKQVMAVSPAQSVVEMTTIVKDSFGVDGQLNMEDVLAVVSSDAEKYYTSEINFQRKAADAFEKQAIETAEAMAAQLQADAEKAAEPHLDAMSETLAFLSLRPSVHGGCTSVKNTARLQVGISTYSTQKNTLGTLNKLRTTVTSVSFHLLTPLSAAYIKLAKEQKQQEEQQQVALAAAMTARKQLNSMPVLLRSAKAKIAKARLSGSAQGKAMLATLMQNLHDEIKNLEVM